MECPFTTALEPAAAVDGSWRCWVAWGPEGRGASDSVGGPRKISVCDGSEIERTLSLAEDGGVGTGNETGENQVVDGGCLGAGPPPERATLPKFLVKAPHPKG